MGTLIKLNSLQKRVAFINHFIGDWKPTPRYKNIANQIEHVSKILELMDSQRIKFFLTRSETLKNELDDMSGSNASITPAERLEQYGHPKEFIDKLYKTCSQVKATLDSVPKIVERLE